jgi:hypothetical protein
MNAKVIEELMEETYKNITELIDIFIRDFDRVHLEIDAHNNIYILKYSFIDSYMRVSIGYEHGVVTAESIKFNVSLKREELDKIKHIVNIVSNKQDYLDYLSLNNRLKEDLAKIRRVEEEQEEIKDDED